MEENNDKRISDLTEATSTDNDDLFVVVDVSDQSMGITGTSKKIKSSNLGVIPNGGTTGQVLKKASDTNYDTVWQNEAGGIGTAVWGSITGNISDQTDLQAALDAKAPTNNPTFTGNVTIPTGYEGIIKATAGVLSPEATMDDLGSPSSDFSMNSQKITSLGDPVSGTDAANKNYTNSVAQELDAKNSVRLVETNNNITRSGDRTIDGITTSPGDRVLLVAQDFPKQNGIYVTAAGAWTRAEDANTSSKVTAGMYTYVEEGTDFYSTGWVLVTQNAVLDTDDLEFQQFTGQGILESGSGIIVLGNTVNASYDGTTINVNGSDELTIPSGVIPAKSINTISTNTSAGSAAKTDYYYFVSGNTTLTLPTAVGNTNIYTIKKTDVSNTVTIATTSSQTIDGSGSKSLSTQYEVTRLISNNSNWMVI